MTLLVLLLVRAVVMLLQVLLVRQGCSSCWQQQGMACSHANSSSRFGLISSSSSTCLARCGLWLLLMQLQGIVALPLLLLPQRITTKPSLSSCGS
jgi:membrane protein required for beta-lactamase induction